MPWSRLDFSASRAIFTPAGVALLLLGSALVASVAFDTLETIARRNTVQARRVQLSTRAAELRAAKAPVVRATAKGSGRDAAPDDAEARRIADAQKVIRTIAAPWNEMFDALESAQDDSIALLSIAPERAAGRLAMTGEAKSYEALTAYLARLDDSAGLMQAQLLAHEIKGGDRHVVFSATANFRK